MTVLERAGEEHAIRRDGSGRLLELVGPLLQQPGIGLRLRGWACNGGNAPWDSSLTSNWGGDHGVPIPVFRAFEGRGPITLVHVDAHLDHAGGQHADLYPGCE